MKHLVIEGPDGAGKTELARALCTRHRFHYHHEGPPPVGVPVFDHYSGLLDNAEGPTVFDRFHLGEIIYGPLLRGGSGLNREQVEIISNRVDIIVCLPPWKTTLRNMEGRHELIESLELRAAAYKCWELVVAEFGLTTYDYTDNPGVEYVPR